MSALNRRPLAARMKEDNDDDEDDDDDVMGLDPAMGFFSMLEECLLISLIPDGASAVTSSPL